MSAAQLRSITLTNFRSIKGTITVPLDAPIVLIHGANGAGKTSLLSAIDRLITIELSRNADGQTLMNYLPHVFTPDQAVAA